MIQPSGAVLDCRFQGQRGSGVLGDAGDNSASDLCTDSDVDDERLTCSLRRRFSPTGEPLPPLAQHFKKHLDPKLWFAAQLLFHSRPNPGKCIRTRPRNGFADGRSMAA